MCLICERLHINVPTCRKFFSGVITKKCRACHVVYETRALFLRRCKSNLLQCVGVALHQNSQNMSYYLGNLGLFLKKLRISIRPLRNAFDGDIIEKHSHVISLKVLSQFLCSGAHRSPLASGKLTAHLQEATH
ncbi:uncharacterized protein LACBIDRAFT_316754 [Laccaria bicolor S238N-H82]|uniref:Predicted protein n=1 Tax=Laccaria bicolor (strain S238N-H82 / ATCC MYA-4686) TaxID=486041 RepID=B0E1J9_LACBS|nr:uncharacterized protein LACBIDRAFT_316754 [Laccaria bicolor S238N-H82]EDQ99276.1 predicted protein [Laccaria bicolor S238N-H82]|eukprot:XP_001890086.1 predicted protein [Laccaria bicolor S238N-H82]